MKFFSLTIIFAAVAATLCMGCSAPSDAITTDMHEDFEHQHRHQHTGDVSHEHEHSDGFVGTHSHRHSHSHRHGEPLHGGHIVSIGHTHHRDGATHFHAEIMPLVDETIRFHLLTESADGRAADYPIDESKIPALISIRGQEAEARKCTFAGAGDGENWSEFFLTIPEEFRDGDAYSIVVPKIRLGGDRQNFSFTVRRPAVESDEGDDRTAVTAEQPGTPDD